MNYGKSSLTSRGRLLIYSLAFFFLYDKNIFYESFEQQRPL